MKRTALFGLFLTATLLASPVFSADEEQRDCASELQDLKDSVMAAGDLGQPTQKKLEDLMTKAEKAQKDDNQSACADAIDKANTLLEGSLEGQ